MEDNWINVKSKLPKDGQRVIAFFPSGNESGELVSTGYRNNHKIVSDYPNSTAHHFEATHWMYLPNLPKGYSYDSPKTK